MKTTKDKKPKTVVVKRANAMLTEKGIKDREMYVLWRSIPSLLALLPEAEQKKMGYDVDDPVFEQLLKIRTKKEFCMVFGVGINEPLKWEQEEGFQQKVDDLSITNHVNKFKKDVFFGFTQKLIRHGDAPRMKLFLQRFEGWTEKTEHLNKNINIDAKSLQALIEERNKREWEAADKADAEEEQ